VSPRKPYQPSSVDRWILRNSTICVTLGLGLLALGWVMIGLDEFDVTPRPLRFLAYGLVGGGIALAMMPRNLRKRLNEDSAKGVEGP